VGVDPACDATKSKIQIIPKASSLFLTFEIYLRSALRKHVFCAADV
jgi:hypothetical protein